MMQQNTPEWLELRKSKIGASDAPIIMGVSPWTTPLQLFEQKLNITPARDISIEAKRRAAIEEEARQKFEEVTGLVMFPQVVFHPSINFMMASLDGITMEGDYSVEIKCPGRVDHECAMDGVVPDKYYPQLQHQMEVTGLDMIFYFTYNENSYKVLQVHRDNEYIQALLKEENCFWQCMQNLEYPRMTDKDYTFREDEVWNRAASEWQAVSREIQSLESKEIALRKLLISMADKKSTVGSGIKLSRIMKKGAVDYKSIPELQVLDIEKYRKAPVETWRIGVC